MSEQAGRERSGGLETSRQNPRLSANQRPKVSENRAVAPLEATDTRENVPTALCAAYTARSSGGASEKKEGNGADCAAPRQGRVRHLVPEVAPKLRRPL